MNHYRRLLLLVGLIVHIPVLMPAAQSARSTSSFLYDSVRNLLPAIPNYTILLGGATVVGSLVAFKRYPKTTATVLALAALYKFFPMRNLFAEFQQELAELEKPSAMPKTVVRDKPVTTLNLRKKYILADHKGIIFDVAFSRNGLWVATAGQDGRVCLWNAANGVHIQNLMHDAAVILVTFSNDGQKVLTTGADGKGYIWYPFSNKYRAILDSGTQYPLHDALFSPDSNLVIAIAGPFSVYVWDAQTGKIKATLKHPRKVTSISSSPDGTNLLTASEDGILRLWQLEPIIKEIKQFTGHKTGILSVSYSSYGQNWW